MEYIWIGVLIAIGIYLAPFIIGFMLMLLTGIFTVTFTVLAVIFGGRK